MQFPESWLRQFCNPPLSTEQLADTLTMGGFEVEETRPAAPPFTGIVVGEIKEAVQHPDADRLRVCQVDVGPAGDGALLNIVCGAPNARVGIKIPCAMVGAELPPGEDGKPFKIKVGKLRGVQSYGMLCSARELGISDEHGGLLELPADAPLGQNVRDYLRLDDTLLTIKLTPNLAHGLSVYGIARELSALTGAPLQTPQIAAVPATASDVLPVQVQASDLCGRFSGRIVKGVNPQAQTPAWMVEQLARCGQRSVSPLVDISNFVMFEYGQPSHIFDLDKIHGGLQVRWARKGEQLELLNGNTVALDEQVGIIADEREVESLAGIMGGNATAVSDDTSNIYIEAAFWWPEAVQGRSRRFNFSTDAGHRFERGVDPSRTVAIIERITALVLEICGTDQTQVGPIDDHIQRLPEATPVPLRVARCAQVIGMPIDAAQCENVFQRLGLNSTRQSDGEQGETFLVTPPPHRFDIQIEADLIEEVARLIGYNNLPDTPPQAATVARVRSETARGSFATRRQLAALGYQETINFSFVEEAWETQLAGNANPIRLLNPIAAPMSVMRSSLIGSLLGALKHNLDRRASRVRLFEVGRVFLRDADAATNDHGVQGIHQPLRVAGVAYGDASGRQWGQAERRNDFYDVKGDVENLLAPLPVTFESCEHPALHPGRSARILLNGQAIGILGELHPKWRQQWELPHAPMLFEIDWQALQQRPLPAARPVPRHQSIERDIAIVLPEATSYADVQAALAHTHAPLAQLAVPFTLQDSLLFDLYRPNPSANANAGTSGGVTQGEKSLAIRLTLDGGGANLTDNDIDTATQAIVQQLQTRLGARLRGG